MLPDGYRGGFGAVGGANLLENCPHVVVHPVLSDAKLVCDVAVCETAHHFPYGPHKLGVVSVLQYCARCSRAGANYAINRIASR